ncbi:hypothetical protein LRS10_12315 [Phenylobacterium sp. J426]|uniref:hypothetical protein n=1 Tax=Phenylobacterium sp. J426 TaxID=2898439 RepID=UPI00215175D0|nr:hypothetical protein [Phenylobacterium sp. J426]MCR5874887.1 hypothetical protein [Phenylobacterium sp. J426]
MTDPAPTHIDQQDPGKPSGLSIREEADREIEAYDDLANLILLMPEERWAEFLEGEGVQAADAEGEARYRGVLFRKAAVTAVVAQEGF